MRTKITAGWLVGHEQGQSHADTRRRGRVRGQPHHPRRQGLRRPRRQDHRRHRQAGGAGLHRHARAFRPPRLAPADHRYRAGRCTTASRSWRSRCPRRARSSKATRAISSTAMPDPRPHSSSMPLSRSPSCIRNGVTTFIEYGSQLKVQDALLAEVDAARHAAPISRPATTAAAGSAMREGRLKRVRNDQLGLDGLKTALRLDRASMTAPPAGACAASWCRARSRPRASSCCSGR